MRGMSKKDTLACQVSLGLFAGLLGIASTAHGAAPNGVPALDDKGVRAGDVTVHDYDAGMQTLNITSNSDNNVIGWKDFSIEKNHTVQFDSGTQTHNYLNVVTGKVTSHIDGNITGGKNVYIANTNGVIFGGTASVNVGNLYVTTRDVDVTAIGNAVAGGATLASQEGSIINTTAAAAPNTAKAEIVSLVDGAGHSVNANKIVLEGQSVRILNSDAVKATNTEATGGVQISVSADTKKFGNSGTEAERAKGYIHVGSAAGGAAPASYHGNIAVDGFKLVGTAQELKDMKNDLTGNYMLKSNINLAATTPHHTPIGNGTTPFTGKFDGMFKEVENMPLGAGTATDYAGLFGNVSGATIMNVGIKNANLSALNYGGAVVGKAENSSHIFNVYNESASMIGSTTANATDAGGIVGKLDNSTLDTAYNTSAIGKKAGGLVGNLNFAQIMDAYNEGAVQINASDENDSWGAYGSGNGTASIVRNVYLHNNGKKVAGSSDSSLSVQESYQITGTGDKSTLLTGTGENDSLSAASYGTWDIAAEGGENKTWRIFEGHSLPLLTAFMKGTVQAEYSYADFQQTGHAHSGDTASDYTVQAADKQTDGSYVTRAGKESNDGKSISRVYNADYLKIAKKNGDGSYSAITDVNDTALKLHGVDDRSLVQLGHGTAGGGRRNAGSNAPYEYEGTTGKGGREAMLYGGQHGYDIAGANVTIGKRKVVGSLDNMGKIEREYDGTADASAQFADAIKTGNVSLRTDGLVDGDGAAVNFTNNNAVTFRTASTNTAALSPDVGYDKSIYVAGDKVKFTGTSDNYDFDATAINALNLKGNITQRTIKATLNPATGIDKVYDGESNVVDDTANSKIYLPTAGNNVLTLTNLASSDTTTTLDYSGIQAKYRTGTSNADPGAETKQAGSHGVAYSGLKLTGANKHNYKLVDGDGNILYRETVTGEPAAMAGDVVTSGTIWGTGTIARRKIDASAFTIAGGADKVYDGTDYIVVNGTDRKVQAPDATSGSNTNVITEDKDQLIFTISATDKKAYYKNTPTATANTKDVYAATNTNGAQYLSYTLKASDKTNGKTLANYELDLGGGTTRALNTTDTYSVTGAGKITPRTVYVDLLKKTGVNKTYDGNADVLAADKTFGTNFGYAEGTAAENQLVPGDGSSITATAAAYATKTGHTEWAQDVYRGTAASGEAEANGKNVVYTIGLAGTNADTNYVLSYGTATPASSVTMTGTGAITPKKLTPRFTAVSRAYNGRSDAAASLLKDNYTLDKVGSDDVALNTNTDTTTPPVSTITGRYYQDATGTTPVSKAGSGYTVKYTGFAAALTGAQRDNYTIADAFDVGGSITKAKLNPSSFVMQLGAKVEKTYDGTALAPNNGLTQVTVGSETINQGSDYSIVRGSSKYYMGTPGAEQSNANADENGNALSSGNPYDVQYTIELQGDAKDNYDLSGLNNQPDKYGTGTYTVDSSAGTISYKKNGIGYIKARKIYVSLDEAVKGTNARNTPTKVYDGTDRLIREGASTGEFIVKFSGGSGAEPTGLAKVNGADVGKNDSIAAYENRNAGDPDRGYLRNVVYTPQVSGVSPTNYVFYHAEGADQGQKVDAAHPLTGRGTITQADLLVTAPADVRRPYNGDTDVASGQGKLLLATPKKHESAAGKNDVDTAGVLDNVALNEIDESKAGTSDASKYYRYYKEKDANANDTASQSQYVTYRRIQLTGTDAVNYRLVYRGADSNLHALERDTMTGSDGKATYTMTGSGIIDRRRVNEGDFLLDFKDVTKRYDGTTVVKKDNDTARANEYIREVSVNLGGAVGKDHFTFGTDGYTLDAEKTQYADENVVNNPGTGKVTYTLNLSKNLLKNYDFSDLNKPAGQAAGYSYNSTTNAVSRTLGVGTITKRPVYAHVVNDNVTKTYNAKKDVVDESGSALTGESLVRFDNIKNGVVDAEAGLVSADSVGNNKVGNNTRAQYTDKNFGDRNRTINYTLAFSGNDPARFNNYELQDGSGNATTTLTTTTNTINRRALKLKADTVTKDYDADKIVKVKVGNSFTPSTTGVGLAFVGGDLQSDESNAQDVVNLGNAYTREYDSPNATRTEEAKKNNVTYSGIKLVAGGNAANYFLADADGKALTGNDTAGYTMKGDGVINPLTVKKSNLKMTFRTAPISKTYDGTAYVDGDTENPAAWRSYITDSYVTDDSNNRLFNIAIDKVNSATYRTGVAAGSDGTADKNAADGKKVLFNIKFSDADQNNFEFDSDFYSGSAGTDRMLRGDDGSSTYNVYTTGDIKKRILTAALGQTSNIHKVYDGGLEADKDNLRVNNFLEGDKDQLDKSAVFDRSNASVSPGETANARTITYTATLTGDAVGNYAFDSLTGPAQKVLTATGDIEKRKVYARVTAPRVKTYDATTDVLINGAAPADGEALVTLGRNNNNDADTGLVDGKGTNKTTAVYAGANAADASDSSNKQVDYKLAIDGSDADGAFADNYIVYDKDGNVVYNTATGRDMLTTSDNTINRAPLSVKAERATKEYDGGRRVKNPSPERLLKITGGWQGSDSGDLNRSGTDSYTTTYLDENVNDKGVDYGNVKIVGEGATKASNYVLSYNGKDVERNGEVYHLHGDGEITKRILTGNDLAPGFTTAPIKKTYDGTTDVKDPSQYVQYMRTRYKKDDGTDLDLAANGYTVERADYLDKADGTKAKDVGKGKDVKFQFALNDGNFDYTGLTGWQPDANGVYHFSENYGRETVTNPDGSISETGRGEITGRNVGVTLHLVQKLYDGTTDVKNGYYTRDDDGKLVEHGNVDVDWNKVISLNGKSGKIAGDENSGFANGEGFDFNVEAKYEDEKVNRGSQFTNSAKRVTYDVRLKDASANKNYTFKYRVVDANGKELAAQDTAQTFVDPKGNDGHSFKGLGDIWQKRLTLKKDGIDKVYDGNANLTEALKKGLQFDGVAQRDRDAFDFSKNDARAQGFVNRISGRYGDLSADGIFTENKHVKRPQGNINGTPEARDLEITGVKSAFESLLQRDDVANNYFYDDANTVYGKGTITPVKATLKKQWTGGDFTKMYDGDPLVRIGGNKLGASFATEEEREANRKAFHDKLNLSVDLGTGEIVQLDYSLYGDAESDFDGDRPRYQKLVDGRYDNDANVLNSTDPNDNLKDVVYKLKSIDGDKNWKPDAENYKDWDLAEDPLGKEIRLSDADANTTPGSSVKPQAYITPRAITLTADEYSKIYDGTAGVAAPSLSADALAAKQKELRDKLHVTDDKTQKLLQDDGVDFTVDVQNSAFLDKNTNRPNADVVRDGAGNVPTNGKSIAYKLEKTGSVLKQANYTLPASAAQTDTFIAAGSITPRMVRVRFNPTNDATPDKIYDGTQYAVKDGRLFSRTFEIVPQGVDEGVVEQDAKDVKLNKTSNIGRFSSPSVQTENGGVQSVYYNDGLALQDGGTGKASNYTLESVNLQDTAKITPRPIDVYLKDGDIRKEYDGTTAVKDKFLAENNLALLDRNPDITDANGAKAIEKPALPTLTFGEKATYDNKNAGNRTVNYTPAWSDKNFILRKGQKTVNPTDPTDPTSALAEVRNLTYTSVDAEGKPQLQDGAYGMKIEADGVIDRRQIKISAAKDAKKIYDGRTNVVDPLGNLSFTYNGTEAEQNEANGIVKGEGDQLKAALRVRGVYRNENNTEDDANAADNETQEHKTHAVRYTFEKEETRDPVLANYEIATDAGGNTVLGKGIIERRTLNVRPDRQATYEGKGNVNYTGRVEDGSAAANGSSPLTPEVEAALREFNSGDDYFSYGPAAGTIYNVPGQTDIYGWYSKNGRKDGEKEPLLGLGNYGQNYKLNPVESKLSIAPRTDNVDRTFRPDDKAYRQISRDENDTFRKYNDADVGLSYRDQGVNMGTATPQAGIVSGGMNIGATGTGNIAGAGSAGSAASVGGGAAGTAGAGAGNAAGAGTNRGAQIGNAALAGGTAGIGGRVGGGSTAGAGASYRPGAAGSATIGGNVGGGSTAGAGGSYRPGAAGSATIGGNVGGGGTAGAGGSYRPGAAGSVDRGLAAAAGMSDAAGGATPGSTAQSSTRAGAGSAASSGYSGGGYSAVDRALADAAGQSIGSNAGYYSGRGYSQSDDDEEEEIRRRARNQASA